VKVISGNPAVITTCTNSYNAPGLNPTSSTSTCTSTTTKSGAVGTTCTYKYTFPVLAAFRTGTRVEALTTVHGHIKVLAVGRIRRHRVRLVFHGLGRGRHRVALYAFGARPTLIARSYVSVK
jgi:hypothetical protein